MSEDEEREISVAELREQLQRKGIPLPFEIGAFIALEVCEQIVRSPMLVSASCVWIGEIGEVLVETSDPSTESDAVRAMLALLGDLLVCSAPGVPPMLLELIEHGPSEVEWTIARLRDDLEACLLPLNRGATRRVLARILREVQRKGERASARPSGAPNAEALDAEFDALLGGEPTPTVRRELTAGMRREPQPMAAPSPAPAEPRGSRLRTEELLVEQEPRGTRGGVVLGGILVFAAIVLGVAYMTLGRSGARKLLGLSVAERAVASSASVAAPARPVAGELRVTSTPERAQVFLFVGTGPALATDLPIGVAQEFVALAQGHAPARAVVAADAQWDSGQGQPRYELAMQVGSAIAPAAAVELGATLLLRDVGAPQGTLGTVRVITTPPGAKVYQLVGFAPNVRVSGLRLDRGYELLVFLEGYALERRTVHAEEFVGQGGERVATVAVTLGKRAKR